MFGKKKITPEIDKQQLELFQNAQRRVKQKRRLYVNFVMFLIGALLLVVANIGLGIAKDFKIFELDWFVIAIIVACVALLSVTIPKAVKGMQEAEKELRQE